MQQDYLTYQEVSKLLNIKLGTLYGLVSKRQIPHIRLGHRTVRFSRDEIKNWVVQNRIEVAISASGRKVD